MRKKYGQNFLISPDARRKIAGLFYIEPGTRVWEIGPGIGAMTLEAIRFGLKLSAFEIDKGFSDFLKTSYGHIPGFELLEGDFIKTWKKGIEHGMHPELVFGNLPYNVAAAIIAIFIENDIRPKKMVFTVQKEAAHRICAKPGTKDYSSFSVLCQFIYKPKIAFNLPPQVFWPQPKVHSSVVIMDIKPDAPSVSESLAFSKFTRQGFSSRRKTLFNNLKVVGISEARFNLAISQCGIERGIRAEALKPEELYSLFLALKNKS